MLDLLTGNMNGYNVKYRLKAKHIFGGIEK